MANDKMTVDEVWDKRDAELADIDDTYGVQDENGNWNGLIGDGISQYQNAADKIATGTTALKDAAEESLKSTISGIELNKKDAETDYLKEQKGAWVDYQKAIDPYGVNAEKMASSGLTNSGFAESSKVAMYNQYQNRVASALSSYQRIVAGYNQKIAEAKAQNSSALAQIEYDSLKEQLTILIEGFQYTNTLVLEKAKAKREVNAQYNSLYMDVLDAIRQEEALKQQKEIAYAQLAEEKRQFNILHPTVTSSGGSVSSGRTYKSSTTGSTAIGKLKNSGNSKSGSTLAPTKEGVAVMKGALTKAQWNKLKAFYVTTGTGNAAVTNYDTYEEYVKDYNEYKK